MLRLQSSGGTKCFNEKQKISRDADRLMHKDDHRTVIQNSEKNQSDLLFCTAAMNFSSKVIKSILKFSTLSEINCIPKCRDSTKPGQMK